MFARSSYQSLSTKEPTAKEAKPLEARPAIHKGLHLFVCLQIMFVTMCCLVVLHLQSDNTSPWVQTLYSPQTRLWIPLFAVNGYLLSCLAMRCVFPTTQLWLLRIGLVLATLSLTLLLAFFSALAVCDPMVRVIRDSALDRVIITGPSGTSSFGIYPTASTLPFLMMPISQVPAMGAGWFTENTPDFFQCAALTPYALDGRLMVGLALINLNCAFAIVTFIAHAFKGTFHATAHAVVLYCFLFVAIMDSIAIVVMNGPVWDWRMFYLGMASAVGASYLATSVLFLPPTPLPSPEKPNPAQLLPKTKTAALPAGTIARAAWICVQPIFAIESFFEKLDEPEDETLAIATENPFPDAQAGYHV